MKENLCDYSAKELQDRLSELKKELMLSKVVGVKDDKRYLSKNIRKGIARVLTEMNRRRVP